jgi:hypothetical protein
MVAGVDKIVWEARRRAAGDGLADFWAYLPLARSLTTKSASLAPKRPRAEPSRLKAPLDKLHRVDSKPETIQKGSAP